MGRRITLLGMGESGFTRKHDILRYCEGTEIWGMNNCYNFYPNMTDKWTQYFELHPYSYLKTWDAGGGACHFTALTALACPITVLEPLPIIRNQRRFPLMEMCRHQNLDNYFLGTPCLMLRMVLYEHQMGEQVDYVQSYGIDQRDGRHAQQRTAWAYWMKGITDAGIDVGGTSAVFMAERDNDIPFNELREKIGLELAKELDGGTESASHL